MNNSNTRSGISPLLAVMALALLATAARAGDFAVIVNKDNVSLIDKEMVAKIYSGDLKSWKDGAPVMPIDLPESNPARAGFSTELLGKTVANVKALWAQMIFAGKALPPKQVAADDDVKKLVAANKGAIGYIKPSSVDDSVKAVLR
jgi:ABC-type phosphate transport system substrate-binding protein